MLRLSLIIAPLIGLGILGSSTLYAMESGGYSEFQKLMLTPLSVLTEKAAETFRGEDQRAVATVVPGSQEVTNLLTGKSASPSYDSKSVAYRIAAQMPELLSKQECYSGTPEHRSVLDCLKVSNTISASLAGSIPDPTCVTEAILIFLWSQLGASPGDMNAAIRMLYDPSVGEPPPFSP